MFGGMNLNLDNNDEDLSPIPFVWPDVNEESSTLELPNRGPDSTLKPEAKYGVFQWWIERAPPWVHPDDQAIADELVPGNRVFRKEQSENFADRELGYSDFIYGQQKLRALPGLWLEVETDGYEVADLVEIKSQYGKLRPRIATIVDIVWSRNAQTLEYFLKANDQRIEFAFSSSDFQPAFKLGSHLTPRELEISARHRFS
jgi:hypothetical protein